MDRDMYELQKEIQKIKKLGYIKGCYPHRSCHGVTLEKLLGKENDELPYADYNGIELKCKKGYSKSKVVLFTANPDGRYVDSLQNIYEKYGWKIQDKKRFLVEIDGKEKHFYNSHYFKLFVDRENREIGVNVYDGECRLIDNDTRWSFELIEDKIKYKINKLALIKCCTLVKDNQEHYWYYNVKFYRNVNLEKFLLAVENGKITIKFTIGTFMSGPREGELHNHGTAFSIADNDLEKIYEDVY